MEETVLKYLMDVAPGFAVAVIMLVVVQRRMCAIEDKMMALLDQCWERLLDHLESK